MSSDAQLLAANALLSSLSQAHGDISSLLTARDELTTALSLSLASASSFYAADAALTAQRAAQLEEDGAALRSQRRRLEQALARLAPSA